MRADQGGAKTFFARARGCEFHGEIILHARRVFDAQFLGVIGNAAIREACERGKFRHQLAARADEVVAELYKFGGKTGERGFVRGALF